MMAGRGAGCTVERAAASGSVDAAATLELGGSSAMLSRESEKPVAEASPNRMEVQVLGRNERTSGSRPAVRKARFTCKGDREVLEGKRWVKVGG